VKKIVLLAIALACLGFGIWGSQYFAVNQPQLQPGLTITLNQPNQPPTNSTNDSPKPTSILPPSPIDYTTQLVAQNLYVPWSLVFPSPDRILVSERSGAIREVITGQLQDPPLITFPEVHAEAEEGLMGLALHPDYPQQPYIYACYAYQGNQGNLKDKVIRFIDPKIDFETSKLSDTEGGTRNFETILNHIPAANFHAGCRLKFGPDGKLYISTGDATDKQIAQDLDNLGGKILRLNPDGTIPNDNPFINSNPQDLSGNFETSKPRSRNSLNSSDSIPSRQHEVHAGSLIFSLGHRNPQGLAWHPVTGHLWSTEHGPSIFDGPAGGDEVNLIRPGQNYGWPIVSHQQTKEGLIDPKLVFTPAEAPASALFYKALESNEALEANEAQHLPQFTNNLFFGALRGQGIIRIILDETDPTQITSYEKLDLQGLDPGRIRELAQSPYDGALYFTTSNRDGRGTLREGDDKIYRIVPLTK
jgi:glucose/arabinose dehydrogenase